ncbi:MAG: hypothetical protein GX862_09480, partial [Leucobacter sp.]|nr:hypothetical protein [Leucobacter sp.]
MCEEARQRRVLLKLAASPHRFLCTREGAALLDEIRQRVVPAIAQAARRLGLNEQWAEADEVVNTVILLLCEDGCRVATLAANSRVQPMNYVFQCTLRAMQQQWGSRWQALDDLGPATLSDNESGVDPGILRSMVHRVHGWLAPRTPPPLRNDLLALLSWLAENPPQRPSHEARDRAAAAAEFTRFTELQIAAVARVAWGARPKRSETSLMGAVLRDPAFDLFDSLSHVRSLARYSKNMRAESGMWPSRAAAS